MFLFKKYSILILGFCCSAFSQSYTPLLDDLNEWHLTSCYFGCLTDVYYTDGDTLVNGKSYKILDGYHYIERNLLLREEVSSKKVYLTITQPQYIEDVLLYDFSLAEGDSIVMQNPISPFPANGGYFTLDSIRFQTNDIGIENKHFYFSPSASNITSSNQAEWVEGIGSKSLINAPGGEPDFNGVGELNCGFKDADLFFSNLDSIASCEPQHLRTIETQAPKIKVLNQAEYNHFLLTNTTEVTRVEVFAINATHQQTFSAHNEAEITLDLSHLKPGLYILKLQMQSGITETLKVIIR